jgi:hypothetical protein
MAFGPTRTFNGRRAAEMFDALAGIVAAAAGEEAVADGLLTAFVNRALQPGGAGPDATIRALRAAIGRIEHLAAAAGAGIGAR